MSNNLFTVVVGLGKTGVSCLSYLSDRKIPVIAMDTRSKVANIVELQQRFPQVEFILGDLPLEKLLLAERVLVSPGVSLKHPALMACRAHNIPLLGDIQLFAQEVKAPVVAVTGSNGKSTVVTLLAAMAEQDNKRVILAGNIGTPVLDTLSESADIYVLELSSFQLETTDHLPLVSAAILNITEDHMDRYDSLADYAQAKLRIFNHCQHRIVNADDPSLQMPTENSFTLSAPNTKKQYGIRKVEGAFFLARGEELLLATSEMAMQGLHNCANALAALAMAEAMGLNQQHCLQVLREFVGLPHRCQLIVRDGVGVSWYNDSKATNVGACIAALEGLGPVVSGKIILLAGGVGKGADFSPLKEAISKFVRQLIVFGESADELQNLFADVVPCEFVTDLQQAVGVAQTKAQVGDAVLLSPACASFDMFNNFEHRGAVFMDIVTKQAGQ